MMPEAFDFQCFVCFLGGLGVRDIWVEKDLAIYNKS